VIGLMMGLPLILSNVSPLRGIRIFGKLAGSAGSKVTLLGGRLAPPPPQGGLTGEAGRAIDRLAALKGLGEGGGCIDWVIICLRAVRGGDLEVVEGTRLRGVAVLGKPNFFFGVAMIVRAGHI
jgi:hypothetical protein